MKVLTSDSTVGCGHPEGKVKTEGSTVLTVKGKGVLIENSVRGKDVETCPIVDNTNTGTLQCRRVATVTGGHAGRLTVEGEPVLLDGIAGTTVGTGEVLSGSLTATANQDRLTAG